MDQKTNIFEVKDIKPYLEDLAVLDSALHNELGVNYDIESWDVDKFSKILPKKWEYSRLVIDNAENKIVGFLIASEMLANEIHVHRLGVRKDFRNKGIGKKLLSVLDVIVSENSLKRITVETGRNNTNALTFYQRQRFILMTGNELKEYASLRKSDEEILEDYTREIKGEEFCLLQRKSDHV